MELDRYILVIISIILLSLIASKAKNQTENRALVGFSIAFGLFVLGHGISSISAAGAINALLIFESGRASVDQGAFDALHRVFDPVLTSGYLHTITGSVLLAFSLVSRNRD